MIPAALIIIVAVVILIIATLKTQTSRSKDGDRSGRMEVYRYTARQPQEDKGHADEFRRGTLLFLAGWILSDLFD